MGEGLKIVYVVRLGIIYRIRLGFQFEKFCFLNCFILLFVKLNLRLFVCFVRFVFEVVFFVFLDLNFMFYFRVFQDKCISWIAFGRIQQIFMYNDLFKDRVELVQMLKGTTRVRFFLVRFCSFWYMFFIFIGLGWLLFFQVLNLRFRKEEGEGNRVRKRKRYCQLNFFCFIRKIIVFFKDFQRIQIQLIRIGSCGYLGNVCKECVEVSIFSWVQCCFK